MTSTAGLTIEHNKHVLMASREGEGRVYFYGLLLFILYMGAPTFFKVLVFSMGLNPALIVDVKFLPLSRCDLVFVTGRFIA